MRRLLALTLAILIALPLASSAQLGTVPHTFSAGTVIRSADVNENFSTAYSNALNRTGGTMTGTLTARNIAAAADSTYDIGTTSVRFETIYADNIDAANVITADVTCTGCTIGEVWTFSANPKISSAAPVLFLNESDQGSDLKAWEVAVSGGVFKLNTSTDAFSTIITAFGLTRAGAGTFASTVTEQGRAFGMGVSQVETFTAGDYTASGSMTWTVEDADVVNRRWRLIGDTLFMNVDILTTTVGGTPSTQLRLKVPGGKTALEVVQVPCHLTDNGTFTTAYAFTTSSSTTIGIQRTDGGNLTAATNATSVQCAPLIFKVS